MRRMIAGLLVMLAAGSAWAENMTAGRIGALITGIAEEAERIGDRDVWTFTLEDVPLTVIVDEAADRMRIAASVAPAAGLSEAELTRLMQANFDTALDARYAIAKGRIWATFIHPLSPLTETQFLSGVGQTVNLVNSYGSTFSSGGLNFGGGDSNDLIARELIERLLKKGEAI